MRTWFFEFILSHSGWRWVGLALGETFEALQQGLQGALWGLQLPRALRKLDNFDFLVLDDLGYLPQGAAESEVLFTLMAERY